MRNLPFTGYAAGLTLIFGLLISGCVSNLGTYDPSFPPDQLSTLKIDVRMGITGFDGKPVSWGIARQPKSTTIAIPAGEHDLRFEYYYGDENIRQSASNFIFTYTFLPNHSYRVKASMFGRTRIIMITMRDETSKKTERLMLN
jgi:hypothetical protein